LVYKKKVQKFRNCKIIIFSIILGKRKRVPTLKAAETADLEVVKSEKDVNVEVEKVVENSEKIAQKDKDDKDAKKTKGPKVKKDRASIPCPRCGKKHRNEDHLEKHIMVVHEGIKPYLCDICGYGTTLRVKMDLHMATKHNEDKIMSYMCEVCDYKCSNQLHLRAHQQVRKTKSIPHFLD
jgi:DNA repair exonuclease SbcCD ATPase subunit